MIFKSRLQKRPTVQWFWEVDCENDRQYNGFGRSTAKAIDSTMVLGGFFKKRPTVPWFSRATAKTADSTMILGGRLQKRPTVQWFLDVDCKNDRQYNGFGKSIAKTIDCTMILEGRLPKRPTVQWFSRCRLEKRPTVQWFWEADIKNDWQYNDF